MRGYRAWWLLDQGLDHSTALAEPGLWVNSERGNHHKSRTLFGRLEPTSLPYSGDHPSSKHTGLNFTV